MIYQLVIHVKSAFIEFIQSSILPRASSKLFWTGPSHESLKYLRITSRRRFRTHQSRCFMSSPPEYFITVKAEGKTTLPEKHVAIKFNISNNVQPDGASIIKANNFLPKSRGNVFWQLSLKTKQQVQSVFRRVKGEIKTTIWLWWLFRPQRVPKTQKKNVDVNQQDV